jgi:hypothetical protein
MALRTDFDLDRSLGRAGFDDVSAGAGDGRFWVNWVNRLFHKIILSSKLEFYRLPKFGGGFNNLGQKDLDVGFSLVRSYP